LAAGRRTKMAPGEGDCSGERRKVTEESMGGQRGFC